MVILQVFHKNFERKMRRREKKEDEGEAPTSQS
jgi:hypothetical protein